MWFVVCEQEKNDARKYIDIMSDDNSENTQKMFNASFVFSQHPYILCLSAIITPVNLTSHLYYLPSTRTIHNTHYHGVVTQLASVLLSTTLFYYSNANIYIITNKPQISSYKGTDNGQWRQSLITFGFLLTIPSFNQLLNEILP